MDAQDGDRDYDRDEDRVIHEEELFRAPARETQDLYEATDVGSNQSYDDNSFQAEYFEQYEVNNGLPRSDARAVEDELRERIDRLDAELQRANEDLYYAERSDDYDYWDDYEARNGLPNVQERDAQDHPVRTAIARGLRTVAAWIEGIESSDISR